MPSRWRSASIRPRTRAALLFFMIGTTAALATRTYGLVSEIRWAYRIGELGMELLFISLGISLVAGTLLDRLFVAELRPLRGPIDPVRLGERAAWIIIGSLIALTGLAFAANSLYRFLSH